MEVAERPLVRELVDTGKPHIRVSAAGLQALATFRERLRAGEYELVDEGCLCSSHGANRVLVATEDRYGLPFRTYLCRDCGLIFTTPRMSGRSVVKFYDVEYRAIYRGKPKATEAFFAEQARHGRQIMRRAGRPSPGRVFDIGCGAGGVLVPFKEAGWTCYGCDFGSEYLERGHESGLTLEVGSYETLRQYAPADLIVASHVLEHCLNPVDELKGWASLLSKDGLIYIEVPGLFDVYRNYKSLAAFFHVAHTFNFTLGTLRSVAAQAGLKFIAGNESVWALFALSDQPVPQPKNDIKRIERFLSRKEGGSERIPREARRTFLRLLNSGLKKIGL